MIYPLDSYGPSEGNLWKTGFRDAKILTKQGPSLWIDFENHY